MKKKKITVLDIDKGFVNYLVHRMFLEGLSITQIGEILGAGYFHAESCLRSAIREERK